MYCNDSTKIRLQNTYTGTCTTSRSLRDRQKSVNFKKIDSFAKVSVFIFLETYTARLTLTGLGEHLLLLQGLTCSSSSTERSSSSFRLNTFPSISVTMEGRGRGKVNKPLKVRQTLEDNL